MRHTDTIRTATIEDAETLAQLQLECWRETYSGLLSPDFFARQSADERLAMWLRLLHGPHAGRQFVAVVGGRLVGFAGSLPPRPLPPGPLPPAAGSPDPRSDGRAELWGIYVLKAHHGSGLGQRLLDATLGAEPAALWVAQDNPRAQAFYRRNGFEFNGTKEAIEDWEGLVELRMTR
jgi:ribosomal protein S18 acetylase RimI-like enzyme